MDEFKENFLEFCSKVNSIPLGETEDDDLKLIDGDEFWDGVNKIIDEAFISPTEKGITTQLAPMT